MQGPGPLISRLPAATLAAQAGMGADAQVLYPRYLCDLRFFWLPGGWWWLPGRPVASKLGGERGIGIADLRLRIADWTREGGPRIARMGGDAGLLYPRYLRYPRSLLPTGLPQELLRSLGPGGWRVGCG